MKPRYAWMRLIPAWIITFIVLPYLWGRTLVTRMLVGALPLDWAASTGAAVLLLLALTWNVRLPNRGVGVLGGWLLANGILFGLFSAPTMPLWQLLAVQVPATVWVVWIAWLGAWPMRWSLRLGLLLLWLALGVIGPVLVKVNGLTGDTENAKARLSYSWRTFGRVELPSATNRAYVTPTNDDFPRYLGPDGTGVLANIRIAGDWTKTPPRVVWRRPVGEGWGGFVIVGQFAFTQEQRDDKECVCCYRLESGEPVWVHEDHTRYTGIGGPGPRATPAFANGRLYTVGATGILNCLGAIDGRPIWSVNFLAENHAQNDVHGTCASPLVDDERVIVCPTGEAGPSLVAYHAMDGKRLWATGTDRASYSSPMIATLAGVRQILLDNQTGITGHDASTGKVLWTAEWVNPEGINAGQALVGAAGPDTVLLSSAYGKGVAVFHVGRSSDGQWSAEEVWSNINLKAKFSTPVLYRGNIYGLDDGILTCLDPTNGKRRWKDGRYGHGQLLLAGDRLLVQTEAGPVVLVEPSPGGLKERGRVEALTSKTWNTLALAGRWLLVRNDKEAVGIELPK
jgi:outer membrane protein assembly factor BamB